MPRKPRASLKKDTTTPYRPYKPGVSAGSYMEVTRLTKTYPDGKGSYTMLYQHQMSKNDN